MWTRWLYMQRMSIFSNVRCWHMHWHCVSNRVTDRLAPTVSPTASPTAVSTLSGGSCPLDNAAVGVPYTSTIIPVGGVAPFTFEITSPAPLPAETGMSLNPTSGTISGTPSAAVATTAVTIKIADSHSQSVLVSCAITVSSAVTKVVNWAILLLLIAMFE